MDRAEKRELVASLQSTLSGAGSIVLAQNAGLNVAALESLRRDIKQAGGQVRIAKNRLAKLALKETDNADMSALLNGPIVIAYADDPMTAPKIAAQFAEKNAKYVVLGGAMGQTALDADSVKALSTMPSLDELRATLAGMLKQPATRIASVVVAPAGGIARLLSAHAEKSNEAA
ncbi:50S ribosomal protein L10 [Devosia algicola]|uniref:Large ribosomal subunit protein uL10 n=1 Tax=Devosia algicola TaxID=3026418 RepID=A0ABY7YQH6_9HYPH|nr:50S ribosomal protein L10 [Devosia algicola]WDR03150.1 50S ribosomal protein L10 [Devosia algicola]